MTREREPWFATRDAEAIVNLVTMHLRDDGKIVGRDGLMQRIVALVMATAANSDQATSAAKCLLEDERHWHRGVAEEAK